MEKKLSVFKEIEKPSEVVKSFFSSGEFKIYGENILDVEFNGEEIKNDNEKKQFHRLITKSTFEECYDGEYDQSYVIDLSWLHQKVLNNDGVISEKDFYLQITDDDSLNGCLYFLGDEKQSNLTYLELLACTGLKQTILDKISEIELRCAEIRNRYLNCIKLKNGGVIILSTCNVEYYASLILQNKLSQDQYKYYFGSLDGFEYDNSGKMSREIAGKYFLNRWRAKSVGRTKLQKSEISSSLNNKSYSNNRLNDYKQSVTKASGDFKRKFSY